MSNPPPALTGTLESTPLVSWLVYALDQRLTGTLVLEQADGRKHAVFFDDGAPAKVRLAAGGPFLGELLVALRKLSPADHERTRTLAAADDRLHGSLLLEEGLIDEATLRDALREQLGRKLEALADLEPETVWGYYDRVNYLERYGAQGVRSKPLALIWHLVQKHANQEHVAEVIEHIGGRVLRLHADAPVLRFHFARRDQAVIEVLRARPQPYAELHARELVEPSRLAQLVFMLAITRQLELDSPDLMPLGSSEPPSSSNLAPAPPPTRAAHLFSNASKAAELHAAAPGNAAPVSTEAVAFRAELRDKLAKEESFYELLGVAPQAEAAQIQERYLKLAKKWHPDRLAPEYADVKEAVTRIFSRMSEAQQTLCDPLKRREYDQRDRRAAREAEEAEQVHRALRAATSFQRAEIWLKRGSPAQAEEEARKALAEDPSQPEYRALVAWLDAQKPGADLNAAIAVLDKAISLAPNDVRSRWYRGQLWKRVGRDTRAVRDFRAIVEQDPRHVDAQREIRLFEMRHSGRPSSDRPSDSPQDRASKLPDDKNKGEGGSGLLRRIFKR